MGDEIAISDNHALEAQCQAIALRNGVSYKIITKKPYPFLDETEQYVVFGINGIRSNIDVEKIYIRNQRSNAIFYPDYYVAKITDDTPLLALIDDAVTYCKDAAFLKRLYAEFGLPLPEKIRLDEIGALYEFDSARNNEKLAPDGREDFYQGLKKFFKQEKTRSKYLQKWRAFSRTDKFDRNASRLKMFIDFHRRNTAVTSVEQLHATNDDLKTCVIHEHEYEKFREIMAKLHPDVLYAVSAMEVQNRGYVEQLKSVKDIEAGAFGKVVTYEAFCEEREKRFAEEGYAAIEDLSYSYFEMRQLTYKEIDEPFVAAVLNGIRYAYAKPDELNAVLSSGRKAFGYLDVPVEDMMNFVSLAKANKLAFYIDFDGKFGKPNFETLRVVYHPQNEQLTKAIAARIVHDKINNSHVAPSPELSPCLDLRISQAQNAQEAIDVSSPRRVLPSHQNELH